MTLVTRIQLAARSTAELRALYRQIFNALARSAPGSAARFNAPGSAARRNALAALETIAAELAERHGPTP